MHIIQVNYLISHLYDEGFEISDNEYNRFIDGDLSYIDDDLSSIEYEANNLLFLDFAYDRDQLVRNFKLRLLKNDYSQIFFSGLSTMILLNL